MTDTHNDGHERKPMDETDSSDARSAGPLAGLKVLDLSTTLPGAMATQFLADSGAEVLMVEPPGGTAARELAGWPGLGRGKRSTVLDLHEEADNAAVWELVGKADVLVTTFRPATARRLGFTAERLAGVNPRLVSAEITGWGTSGPYADVKGYEGLIMAKFGGMHGKGPAAPRPGPAFIPTSYSSWAAAHTAIHGILAALHERETSGLGQHVEADLLRGTATMDTYSWFVELVALRWPDAFTAMPKPWDEQGRPRGRLIYNLLIAPTKDGHWLQFAQTEPRLFKAFIEELGLTELFAQPRLAGFPDIDDPDLRMELWETMLESASSRTLEEWERVFQTNPSVRAELYRRPWETFDHPQLVHDGRVVEVEDPGLGPVRQPSTLVHSDGAPLRTLGPAPMLGDASPAFLGSEQVALPGNPVAESLLPLADVTILELGSMFAGPFGATLLTDLGARVIKVEPIQGDTMRRLAAFPEAGAAKVLQGKESIALDITSEEGLAIVHRLAGQADVVLQTYRAGAAERARVDAATLKAINPGLVYLNAPGYGTDGPYGHSPAYAPSMGAASGLALSDVPDAAGPSDSLDVVKASIPRLYAGAGAQVAQADGVAALAVASAILLGIFARDRHRPLGTLATTMLASATHCLIDRNVQYAGGPEGLVPDEHLLGFSALYRLYEAKNGWVFLAAPQEREWESLVNAMEPYTSLNDDDRFATPAGRAEHDDALAEVLDGVFRARANSEWETELTAADVGCVAVTEMMPELYLQSGGEFAATYTTTAMSPVFDEHLRLSNATTFSRSRTKAGGGCLCGQHTDSILKELGYDDASIRALHDKGVLG